MNKLMICAVVASGVAGIGGPARAQSGFSFDIDGQRVHIGVPKHCADEHCISITTGKSGVGRRAPADEQHIDGSQLLDIFGGLMGRPGDDDDPAPRRSAARPPARAPAAPGVPAPAAPPAPAAALPPSAPPAAPVSAPPAVAAAAPGPDAALPPPSPVGTWLTENSEGRIHIVPCGSGFCGYAVDARSARDGEKVLIDMKAVKNGAWKGRVRDPRSGGLYDATMSLKDSDTLGVRGCAMGGFICQGQTWTRG